MHVARENALEKAASGFRVITCSDSLSSAVEESVRGTMGRGKTGSFQRELVRWREVLIGVNMA